MIRKIGIVSSAVIITLAIIYLLGPKVEIPELSTQLLNVSSNLIELEKSILEKENALPIKPGNASQLVWANDSVKEKTPYSLVYLHGFSASPEEGNPVHRAFAKHFGMNLYIPRLYKHGLDTENTMLDFTAEGFIESAKEAIAVGQQIGDSVIVMSCSTGGTAALFIASGNPDIHSLILYSPNIDLYNTSSNLITMPWGLTLLKTINGGDTYTWQAHEEAQKYWHTSYRIESVVQMKGLLQATMKEEIFNKIHQPIFIGYYYKNEEEQDKTVSVKRMHEMYNQVSSPESKKRKVPFPNANTHGIQNIYFSNDYEGVLNATILYAEEVLKLPPVAD